MIKAASHAGVNFLRVVLAALLLAITFAVMGRMFF